MALKKELNLLDIFCIACGAMLSSGIFLLPGLVYLEIGPAVLLAYLLSSFLALLGVLSQCELASAMPKAGGSYFYITRSLGPGVGTVYGLITWLSLILKSAFGLFGLGLLLVALFPVIDDAWRPFISAAVCIPVVILNIAGAKGAGKIQVYSVFFIFAVLIFYTLSGLGTDTFNLNNFRPVLLENKGTLDIITGAGFVFVSFGGLLKVASIAEEVKNPGKNLPLGMLLSLFVITGIYLLIIFVTVGAFGPEFKSDTDKAAAPILSAAKAFMPFWGYVLMAIASGLAFVGVANAGVMASSRFPMALSRDNLIPDGIGKISPKFGTPIRSIIITGIMVAGCVFIDLKHLVHTASAVLILTYMFSCIAVIILRESKLENYRPQFKAPLYPYVPILGIIGCGVLLLELGVETMITSGVVIVVGLLLYWFYGRIRSNREYALLHLIERLTAKELTDHGLETELKEIIHERDEVSKDKFDHLIEASQVLDIEKAVDLETCFRKTADAVSIRIHHSSDEVYEALIKREKQSPTVLSPYMAIPHIIVEKRDENESVFDVLLLRCKGGVRWSDEFPAVHAVFVLAGTVDERHFHLITLAALAQIVLDPDFDTQWMAAKTEKNLRDVILLGKRQR